ncbi:D-alanyl-D-alanine carboxypeptidase family protein [Roseibium hamelinense]|uniref:D-alanyl-D-alanine carboxypeptidase family protein n=1 Tax=Roseibium hamelinense TaxID=150831 RepID=UPI001AD942B9|nr:D-alanyl-D-alanine carboxypeptidase family protein [Roseibium hamelinense]
MIASFRLAALCAATVFVMIQPAKADIGTYILIDARTGDVLDQKDPTRLWYPASLTKIMTAYVTYKAIREGRATLDSVVVQSKNSLAEPPSKMGFRVGTTLTVDAALKIILIKSANDIAVALGEAIAGSETGFIAMMNAEAKRLGMVDTRFVNPHGLPDNRQITTARDMAILAQAFWQDFPEARDVYKHPGIKFGKKTLRSANREYLLRVPGANGMKTGYICNSGYNVAATATRGNRTLIAIVMGAASGLERIAHTRHMMDEGFRKRSGRFTVATLPRAGGRPPADGYCRRNPKPGAKGIMARYDLQGAQPSTNVLSLVNPARKEGGVLIPGLFKGKKQEPKPVDAEEFKLANGKTDWGKILDRSIGPRRIAYRPIAVTTRVPAGASSPVALAPAINVPIPTPNPRRQLAAAVARAAAEAVSGSDAPQRPGVAVENPSPGSLFRKGIGFSAPVPPSRPEN